MQLGTGYWSLPAIDRRILELESRKPKKWKERLKKLHEHRAEAVASADQSRLVKGWAGRKKREQRHREMLVMLNTHSLAEVGKKFGISRQRVHQIISKWK